VREVVVVDAVDAQREVSVVSTGSTDEERSTEEDRSTDEGDRSATGSLVGSTKR
jgi:hypothetical protein